MKKIIVYLTVIIAILFIFISCATYNIRLDATREWIEGKPYPAQITFNKIEKISNVVLHYSFNGGGVKTAKMKREGAYFSYTIPGEEVVPGILRYSISYSYKGRGKSTDSVSVRVLSFADAKEKLTRELSSRISFFPPEKVAVNRDKLLIVNVRSHKPSTRVTFYIKSSEQAAFQETELVNLNGNFTAEISRSELQAGYNTYYFLVTEDNADVGKLEVYVHGRDNKNPFRFKILSLAELREVIIEELYRSIHHQVPQDVFVTKDLELTLSVNYSPDTFIHEFSKNSVSVEIFYRRPGSDFKQGVMSGFINHFTYIIPSNDLRSDYNSYYFKITDDIEDIGTITVEYPGRGDLFSYNILSIDEIRKIKRRSLYNRISHTPISVSDGVSDLYITLEVRDAGRNTTAVLFFKRPAFSQYKSINMTKDRNIFNGVISIDEQQNGYTQYYFRVTEMDSDVGIISVVYPRDGHNRPIQYTVLDKNIVKNNLETDLRARISHRPVTSAVDGEDLKLYVKIANIKEGTQVFFYHRKPGESSYRRTRLSGYGPEFTMIIPKQDIHAGYSQYYIEAREPHDYFGFIVATLAAPKTPYEFEISKLKDAILDGIDFVPLPDVEYGTPVEAKIVLNNNPEGTRLYLKYRLSGDTLDYFSIEMQQTGTEYSAVLSQALLQEGKRIDYYIFIISGQDEFTYPDESIIPLYFYIKEQLIDESGDDTVFGNTSRIETNMLEGRIFQLEPGTKTLPRNMHKDYESLIVLYTEKIDIPPRNFTEGFPGLENVFEWFGIQYRGTITIEESGLYNFRLLSDDGSKLFIDSILVIDNDGTHAPRSKTGGIYLSPGTYPIRVDYFQGPKMKIALQLFVTKPGEEEKLFDINDFE
jgi:hypothetical protein